MVDHLSTPIIDVRALTHLSRFHHLCRMLTATIPSRTSVPTSPKTQHNKPHKAAAIPSMPRGSVENRATASQQEARCHARSQSAVPRAERQNSSVRMFDDGCRLVALASAELSYPERGATRGVLPAGYAHIHRDMPIATGRVAFDKAANALFGWQVHRAAGIIVTPSHHTAAPGVDVVMRVGWGPASLTAPCRVVYCVEEPATRGFAYVTLPGHPERGEEAFLLELSSDRTVRLTIRAFSRPASTLARLGGPLTGKTQNLVTERCVLALRDLTQPT